MLPLGAARWMPTIWRCGGRKKFYWEEEQRHKMVAGGKWVGKDGFCKVMFIYSWEWFIDRVEEIYNSG